MRSEPVWLTAQDVSDIHDDQIGRFGGARGLKSLDLLESTVAAPQNHFAYDDQTDVLRLGTILAHAVAKDHPFIDGNKRTATLAMLEFLFLNGLLLLMPDDPEEQPLAEAIEALTARELTAVDLATRLRPFIRQA